MSNFNTIRKNILTDIKVELADEFDRNFERKGFFSNKWKERKSNNTGSLMQATGTLRKSIRARVQAQSVTFSSSVPYASIHNEGGTYTQNVPAHQRKSKDGKAYLVRSHTRTGTMPQRKFIGKSPEVEKACKLIIQENMKVLEKTLLQNIKNNML